MKISSETTTILFSCKKNINPTLENIVLNQRELKINLRKKPKKKENPNKKFWIVLNSPIMEFKLFSISLIPIEIKQCTTKNGSDFANFLHYTPSSPH
jgi:hypothetical protein